MQQAMAAVWNVPLIALPGFGPRLMRSLIALAIIGGAFVLNAAAATGVTNSGLSDGFRGLALGGMVVLNAAAYLAVFRSRDPVHARVREHIPGAVLASLGFTLLITVGSGLVQHQLRHSSASYGPFGLVIGLVGFLFLLAKISLYGAELNPVVTRHLWPRGMRSEDPTPADDRVLSDITHQSRRRKDQCIGVGFGDTAAADAAIDAHLCVDGQPSEAARDADGAQSRDDTTLIGAHDPRAT